MTEEKKLEELFDLTNHPGWIFLMEDMYDRVEAFKEGLTRNESTSYQIGLAQGHIKVYREFLNLRAMIELAIEQNKDGQVANV